jgi:hypothetical protein
MRGEGRRFTPAGFALPQNATAPYQEARASLFRIDNLFVSLQLAHTIKARS